MNALLCVLGCVIAPHPFGPSVAATTPDGDVGFALRSQWFGEDFTLRPARPDADDVIYFTDPWGNRGLGNRCVSEAFWGTPRVHVDHVLRHVRIEFTGGEFQLPVNRVCPTNVVDVGGLIGHFGPLAPGLWTYQAGDDPPRTFTVVPEPAAAVALVAPAAMMFAGRRQDRTRR